RCAAGIWRRFIRPAIKVTWWWQCCAGANRLLPLSVFETPPVSFGVVLRRLHFLPPGSRGDGCTAFGPVADRMRSGVASAKIYRSKFKRGAVTDGRSEIFQNGFRGGVWVNLR